MTNWVVIPHVTNWPLTKAAIEDSLAQSIGDVRVLLINNGPEPIPSIPKEVLYWRHHPPMLSLSATWNRALGFVWETGEDHALVINNDVRIHPSTYQYLVRTVHSTGALFVTATGVTLLQYEQFCQDPGPGDSTRYPWYPSYPLPGPDFSCFLITKKGHTKYPFDENYIPAFIEDISAHRMYMLGGDGQRIFGTGLPYYHVGSSTLKSLPEDKAAALHRRIDQGSRQYHLRHWGGPANQERFIKPFGPEAYKGVTTPELFERVRYGLHALPDVLERDETYTATPNSPTGC